MHEEPLLPPTWPTYDDFCQTLFPEEDPSVVTMALLDAGRWPNLGKRLMTHDGDWVMVYKGSKPKPMSRVVPYAAEVKPDSPFLAELYDHLGKRNTLFVRLDAAKVGNAPALTLAMHMWPLLHPRLFPQQKKVWMRLYDPAIFLDVYTYLTAEQQARIFGDCIVGMVAESWEHGTLVPCPRPAHLPQLAEADYKKPLVIDEIQQQALDMHHCRRFLHATTLLIAEALGIPLTMEALIPLQKQVIASIDIAEQHGFMSDRQTRDFVRLDARLGWHLLDQPEATAIVQQSHLRPATRLHYLRNAFATQGDSHG